MDDAIAVVNENADKAQAREKSRSAEAMDEAIKAARVSAKRARKKANRQIVLRAVATLVVCALFWLAGFYGLMDARLTVPLMGSVCSWFAFWFGAWVQFMWADGGLLNVNAE